MTVLKTVRDLHQYIARPSAGIVDRDERAKASLISTLLFLYLLLTLASWAGVTMMLNKDLSAELHIVFFIAVPVFAALYGLSRSKHFSIAAHVFVLVNIGLIFFPAVRGPKEEFAYGLYHLANSLIICSLILPARSVIVISLACLAGVTALPWMVPHVSVPFISIIMRFLGFSAILIIVITVIRERRLREARTAERQAKEAEHRFRVLADHASEGVAMLSGTGDSLTELRVTELNARFSSIFSPFCLSPENKTLESIFPVNTHSAIFEAIRTDGSCEITTVATDRTPKSLLVSSKSLNDGHPGTKILIVSDVSAAKEAEALRTQKLAAEAANQAKSIFLASVSHEIRTPLTAILGFSELIKDNSSPEKIPMYVERILQNGIHLSQLINNVIDLSRIEAGQLIIDASDFSPAQEISWSVDQLRWKAEKKRVRIETPGHIRLPGEINSDPVKFRQILFNLLDNAIKFSPENSQITITASAGSRPDLAEGVRLTIDVTDQGPGIPEDLREKIFNYFEQDYSQASNPHGSGIGLALSRRLARALGGDLELIPANCDPGSTFRFSLLCTTSDTGNFADTRIDADSAGSGINLAGYRILVVDDNADNQTLSQTILSNAGAKTEIAGDGHTAVEKGSEGGFDLILMDIRMPGLSGDQAAQALRRNGFQGPIIALTADALRTTNAPGSFDQFDGFLVKPINSQVLLSELQKHLRR